MKKFLVICFTVLMFVCFAQADLLLPQRQGGIVSSVRSALSYLSKHGLVMDFTSQLARVNDLLKNERIDVTTESGKLLNKMLNLSAQVVAAQKVNDKQKLKELEQYYNQTLDGEIRQGIFGIKQKLSKGETTTSASVQFNGILNQLFGVKTALAAEDEKSAEDLAKELLELQKKEIEFRMKEACKDKGLVYASGSNECCEQRKIKTAEGVDYCGCPTGSIEIEDTCCRGNKGLTIVGTWMLGYSACGCTNGGSPGIRGACCKDGRMQYWDGEYRLNAPANCPCRYNEVVVSDDKGLEYCCPSGMDSYSGGRCCKSDGNGGRICCEEDEVMVWSGKPDGTAGNKGPYVCCPKGFDTADSDGNCCENGRGESGDGKTYTCCAPGQTWAFHWHTGGQWKGEKHQVCCDVDKVETASGECCDGENQYLSEVAVTDREDGVFRKCCPYGEVAVGPDSSGMISCCPEGKWAYDSEGKRQCCSSTEAPGYRSISDTRERLFCCEKDKVTSQGYCCDGENEHISVVSSKDYSGQTNCCPDGQEAFGGQIEGRYSGCCPEHQIVTNEDGSQSCCLDENIKTDPNGSIYCICPGNQAEMTDGSCCPRERYIEGVLVPGYDTLDSTMEQSEKCCSENEVAARDGVGRAFCCPMGKAVIRYDGFAKEASHEPICCASEDEWNVNGVCCKKDDIITNSDGTKSCGCPEGQTKMLNGKCCPNERYIEGILVPGYDTDSAMQQDEKCCTENEVVVKDGVGRAFCCPMGKEVVRYDAFSEDNTGPICCTSEDEWNINGICCKEADIITNEDGSKSCGCPIDSIWCDDETGECSAA